MALGRADDLDVDGAEALLAGRQAARGRLLLAAEVRLERLHPGGREQHGGVVNRRHERRRGQAQVPALLEEAQERLADLGRLHGRWSLGPQRPICSAAPSVQVRASRPRRLRSGVELCAANVCIPRAPPLGTPMNLTMGLVMQDEHLVGEARERRKQQYGRARARGRQRVGAALPRDQPSRSRCSCRTSATPASLLVVCTRHRLRGRLARALRVRRRLHRPPRSSCSSRCCFLAPAQPRRRCWLRSPALPRAASPSTPAASGTATAGSRPSPTRGSAVGPGAGARRCSLRATPSLDRPAASTCSRSPREARRRLRLGAHAATSSCTASRSREVVESCLGTNRVALDPLAGRLLPALRGRRRAARAAARSRRSSGCSRSSRAIAASAGRRRSSCTAPTAAR